MLIFGRSVSVSPGRTWFRAALLALGATAVGAALLDGFPVALAGGSAEFDVGRARADLEAFVGDGTPRIAGQAGAAAARDRLVGRLGGLGLAVDRASVAVERRAGKVLVENIVAEVPGREGGEARVALVCHTDSAPGAPGASDDGAGVACAVELARCLVADPPRRPLLLVFTDGEERGLLGAQAFVANDPRAAALHAVVNMDARGASGPAFVFETGPETLWLSGILSAVPGVRSSSLMGAVYEAMPNGTDFTVFRRAGVSGFNVAFIGDVAAYHTPLDTVARQSPGSLEHLGRTAIGLVRGLDRGLPEDGVPGGRAAYGDVLGLFVVRWPEAWSLPAAAAALLLVGASVAPARRGAWAMGAAAVVMAVSAAIGWGLGTAADAAGLDMATAPARLLALDGGVFVAAIAASLGAGAFLARRGVAAHAALAGAWAPWGAVAVGSALAAPAVSFPFVLPLAALAAACAGARIVPGARPSERLLPAAFVGCATAGVVLLPLEPPVMDALGLSVGWANGLRAALLALPLMPLAAAAVPETSRGPGVAPGPLERDRLGSNQQPSVS